MTGLQPLPDTNSDRIKLPLSFDADALTRDVESLGLDNFIYYDVMPLRAPAHQVDPSLPPPPSAEDYADGSWTDWLDTRAMQDSPNIRALVDRFRDRVTVNLVRLLRLEPGALVKEHNDPTLGIQVPKSMIRLTIPIISDEQVAFYLNDRIVPMRPGECWYLRLTDRHRIENQSTSPRVNLSIDVVPNDWIRTLIFEHDRPL